MKRIKLVKNFIKVTCVRLLQTFINISHHNHVVHPITLSYKCMRDHVQNPWARHRSTGDIAHLSRSVWLVQVTKYRLLGYCKHLSIIAHLHPYVLNVLSINDTDYRVFVIWKVYLFCPVKSPSPSNYQYWQLGDNFVKFFNLNLKIV